MKKKLLSAILCVAMLGTMLAGCATKEDKPADTATPDTKTEDTKTEDKAKAADTTKDTAKDGELYVYLVSKGFQHQFWQAVYQGAQEKAKELGVKMDMQGPNTESDIQDQVQMLNNAVNLKPNAIGLAALDTEACLEGIKAAQTAGIPIIGFDSGVKNPPEGSVLANASTDNYKAGELAAEETYKVIKEKITGATKPVRIGVMSQDATSESIVNRGKGFIDKIKTLIEADGKKVSVEGNDKFTEEHGKVDKADVIIDVAVPASVAQDASTIDGQNLMNKADTICIYASNQHSGEGLVNANANLNKLGADGIIGVAFDSGTLIKSAVKDGTLIGAVTQDPLSIGRNAVELAVKAAKGEPVSDVDTGCQWYTKDNMEDPQIAPNLYD